MERIAASRPRLNMDIGLEGLVENVGAFIARNAFWAGPILGLITFGESMVVIGAFFPATALMLVAGGLAAAGVLNPVEVVAWCVAGAVGGDAVSYWIGRRVGPSAWRHPVLTKRRRLVARARLFFQRNGVLSIYLCRFMGPVRAFVPLIAGMTSMPHGRFQIANVGSALVWVPVMLAPGYLGGLGVSALSEHKHGLEWGLAIAAAVAILAVILRQVLKGRKMLKEGPTE